MVGGEWSLLNETIEGFCCFCVKTVFKYRASFHDSSVACSMELVITEV